jgi:seryl-tRNA synthetase
MLDIAFIRENPQVVKDSVAHKNLSVDVDRLLSLDGSRMSILQEIQDLRQKRNEFADKMKQIATLSEEEKQETISAGKALKEELTAVEAKFKVIDEEFMSLMLALPSIPSEDTPIGKTEDENVVVRTWGEKPQFDFEPKEHWELGEALDLIDTKTAAEISGSRFAYLKGELALMQFGLVQMVMLTLVNQEKLRGIIEKFELKGVSDKPFTPIVPPVMMRPEVMDRMARLHPMDDRYQTTIDGLMMVGSAEHTLGPLYMDTTLEEAALPIRYIGYSTAFRREAGTYGKDMKGILRLHQFDKLEMESFSTPEEGAKEQELFVAIQEHLMQELELPYQVVHKCTADMGTPDVRAFDIEAWLPGQNKYRETHTSDWMGDYQSRRLETKVKRADGAKNYVHMNDATAFAIGRTLIAIMENYQTADGKIKVPAKLQAYVGKEVIG